jgi:hypothetical protein
MERTFITTALSGTNSERKASRSKKNESTSTSPITRDILLEISLARSM